VLIILKTYLIGGYLVLISSRPVVPSITEGDQMTNHD
jgi:hypothetical protein